jgi:hypothetical protein
VTQYYKDYLWKNGQPYGLHPCSKDESCDTSYKIASDPYHKRISVEKYVNRSFSSIIYDSALFDFRHLKQGERLAWQKTSVQEEENSAISHIRNQDDRLILIENYRFEKGLCRECQAYAPFGILISTQKIFYQNLGDPFNGVILFDSNGYSVMSKHYAFDEATREFSELLNEDWEIKKG